MGAGVGWGWVGGLGGNKHFLVVCQRFKDNKIGDK